MANIYIEKNITNEIFEDFFKLGNGDIILTDDKNLNGIYTENFSLETFLEYKDYKNIYVLINNCYLGDIIKESEFKKNFKIIESNFFINHDDKFLYRDIDYIENIVIKDKGKLTRELLDLGKKVYHIKNGEVYELNSKKESIYMILGLLFVAFTGFYLTMDTSSTIYLHINKILLNFKALFLEALPFFLLGSLISALIRTFLKTDIFLFRPTGNKIYDTLKGMISGLFMPICDCAGVPVGISLLNRGVNDSFTLGFMLSAPLLNIIVVISTYAAFSNWKIVGLRFLMGFLTVLLSVTLWGVLGLKLKKVEDNHNHEHITKKNNIIFKWKNVLEETGTEFIHTFGLLSLGILISSVVKVLLPVSNLNGFMAILIAVILAYLFSLCSSSDAFISRALFLNTAGIMAFLIAGPIMDLKNSLVFYRSQGIKNTVSLVLIVMVSTIIVTLLFDLGGII